jgi:hypothetical protein
MQSHIRTIILIIRRRSNCLAALPSVVFFDLRSFSGAGNEGGSSGLAVSILCRILCDSCLRGKKNLNQYCYSSGFNINLAIRFLQLLFADLLNYAKQNNYSHTCIIPDIPGYENRGTTGIR